MNTQLLIIDPQNDFLDIPGASLPVKGAAADMERLAAFMQRQGAALDAVTITLDTHELLDIAHPAFWRTAAGSMPAAFTQVPLTDLDEGRIATADAANAAWARQYLLALQNQGRYVHMIWPVHCQIGGWGHNVAPQILAQLNQWEARANRRAMRVLKGMNPLTEHYSAVRAEVVDPDDPHTQVNEALLARLREADRIYIAGEASSHCVKATVEHLVEYLPGQGRAAEKMVLLTDAMSPVPGFEDQADGFLLAMQRRGAVLARTTD